MKKVKMFFCMAMVVALLFHTTITVWAAVTHVDGCNNTTNTYNECGAFVSYGTTGSHDYYSVTEGDYVECLKTSELCGDVETAVCKKE